MFSKVLGPTYGMVSGTALLGSIPGTRADNFTEYVADKTEDNSAGP